MEGLLITYLNSLNRRLKRLREMKLELELKTKGKEDQFTFYGGYDLGFISGKIAEIENTLDIFDVDFEKESK